MTVTFKKDRKYEKKEKNKRYTYRKKIRKGKTPQEKRKKKTKKKMWQKYLKKKNKNWEKRKRPRDVRVRIRKIRNNGSFHEFMRCENSTTLLQLPSVIVITIWRVHHGTVFNCFNYDALRAYYTSLSVAWCRKYVDERRAMTLESQVGLNRDYVSSNPNNRADVCVAFDLESIYDDLIVNCKHKIAIRGKKKREKRKRVMSHIFPNIINM